MAQTTADVQQLASAYQLGAPKEEYRFKIMRTLIGGLLLLAFGVAAIAFIVISEHISLATMDFSAVDTSGDFWVFVIIGLVLLACGAWYPSKKEGKWFNWSTIGVARIPNFYVFMALVDYASKARR